MNLKEELILKRVTRAQQLDAEERPALQNDAELKAILAENRGFAQLTAPPPPARERLLARVRMLASQQEDSNMSLIERLFAGKSLPLRLAIGAALAVALIALSLFLPRAIHFTANGPEVQLTTPAYAATDGFVLVYKLSGGMDELEPVLSKVKAIADDLRDEYGLGGPSDDQEDKLIVIAEVKETQERADEDSPATTVSKETHLAVWAAFTDQDTLKALREALAGVSGLPEPEVTDATWFSRKGLPMPGADCLSFALQDHLFNFPLDATEEEVEQTITDWFLSQHPEWDGVVDVIISGSGDERQIEIRIKADDGTIPKAEKVEENTSE